LNPCSLSETFSIATNVRNDVSSRLLLALFRLQASLPNQPPHRRHPLLNALSGPHLQHPTATASTYSLAPPIPLYNSSHPSPIPPSPFECPSRHPQLKRDDIWSSQCFDKNAQPVVPRKKGSICPYTFIFLHPILLFFYNPSTIRTKLL